MNKIIKGVEIRIEYGDYDNFVNITPVSFYLKTYDNSKLSAVVKATYRDGREMEFVEDNVGTIDFESFNITLAYARVGLNYKENEVQFQGNNLYIIKNADGTITPFEKFKVEYDYTTPGYFGGTERKSRECETRGEDRAIEYAKRCEWYPDRMSNIVVTKIGE